jgi:hypothetical protein
MNRLPGEVPRPNGVLKVMELGTGFKRFKRSVFVKTLADNPWLKCEGQDDPTKDFFSFFNMGPTKDDKLWPGRHRGLTEDYWFDWLCRASGIHTFVDLEIKLRHKDDHTGRVFPASFPVDPWDAQQPEKVLA